MMNHELRSEYRKRKSELDAASMFLSSGISHLPEFHNIVDLGPAIITFILLDMCQGDHRIMAALYVLTEERPADNVPAGKIDAKMAAWLAWGDEKGYI